VVVEGGLLKLKVTKVQNGDKAYSAAEVASKDLFTFGRFAGRIKFCAGSGMVSSLFTYKEDVDTSWQEIDIEHLGNLPKSMQYNLISGTLNARNYQPKVVTFQWGPPLEFHDYVIEWRPDGVTFFVDGAQTHHDEQATLKDAATLHMNAWPTDNSVTTFAGPFDASAVPCEAQYDWIEAYTYAP
jgi:beta-glucanase (GH16 family)